MDATTGRRAQYGYDASNYRQIPAVVVFPRDREQLTAVVAACRTHGVSLTLRGAGTSIAGQAVGDGVVVDTSRWLNRVLDVDPEARTATVEPGVILDHLQTLCRPHGLHFGPDPSTHSRCTIGGMVGNNSCGSHSLAWGTTADNVLELEVLTYRGARMTLRAGDTGADAPEGAPHADLRALRDRHLATLRTELGQFPRQISGFGLQHLLPERGFDLPAALVGTEGTCVVVLSATVRLVTLPSSRNVTALGFADLPSAGDAVPALLPYQPLACEGLGAEQVATLARRVPDLAPERYLPAGGAWLLCEFDTSDGRAGPDVAELCRISGATDGRQVQDPAEQRVLMRVREESSGLATRAPDGAEAYPGWEDSALPPEYLGDYLRGLLRLLERHQLRGTPYGHFGEGCVHIRIDFDFDTEAGAATYRAFMTEAAELVAGFGGTLSGEHGDGQARAELLPSVYSPDALAAFREFKDVLDPEGGLNPGIVVRPRAMDERLRIKPTAGDVPEPAGAPPAAGGHTVLPLVDNGPSPADTSATAFGYPADDGDLNQAVRRCVGVGKCRSDSGGVMCPSWRATGEETHSTRGRARMLEEMLRGEVITDGWRSTEVHDALDLCLSCKGCRSDCPVGVDMATYKAEFLYHHYANRLRPAAHYSMGQLPLWARMASVAPRAVNAVTGNPATARLLKAAGGIAQERRLPSFARRTFHSWFASHTRRRGAHPSPRGQLVVWPDTFTDSFVPEVGRAAVRVLERAGFTVSLPPGRPCCGLTWISTGQLDGAKRRLRQSLDVLEPALQRGVPIVGLEPSCTAVFRADAPELLPDDPRARQAAQRVLTLAEALDRYAPDADLGQLPEGSTALTQTHCHQHAVLGTGADERVLSRVGVRNDRLDSGCCGLAGNFGFERGHHDLSVRIAELGMLPAVREADERTAVLTDGFSCRTQVTQLSDRAPQHIAELLDSAAVHEDARREGGGEGS